MSFPSLLPGTFNSGTAFEFRLGTNGGSNTFGFDGDSFFISGQGVGGRPRFDDLDPFFERAVTVFGGTLVQGAEFLDAQIAAGQVPTNLSITDGTLAVIEGDDVSGSFQARFASEAHAQAYLDFVAQMLGEVDRNGAVATDPTEFRFAAGGLEIFYDATARDFGFLGQDGSEQRFNALEPFVEALASALGGTQTRDGRFNDQRIADGSVPNIIDVRGLTDLVIGGRSVGGHFKFAYAAEDEAAQAQQVFEQLFADIAETGALGADLAPDARDDIARTDEDEAVTIDVLANDTDADSALTIVRVDGTDVQPGDTVTLASGAKVTLSLAGGLDYDPNGQFDALNAGEQQTDSFTYRIEADGETAEATVTVTIDGVSDNAAPEILTLALDNPENQTIAGFVLAEDADSDTLTWSITGGADADAFLQTGSRLTDHGLIEFATAPDFEQPGDADGDNIYEVEVTVSDGVTSTSDLIEVTVSQLRELNGFFTPEFTEITVPEFTPIGTLLADFDFIDPEFGLEDIGDFFLADFGDPFQLTSDGKLTTTELLDFETQSSYTLFIDETTGELSERLVREAFLDTKVLRDFIDRVGSIASEVLTINVLDEDEGTAPTITTTQFDVPEEVTGVGFVLADDAEDNTLTWSITGGADADAFVQTGTRLTDHGLLEFAVAPDYDDGPTDADQDYTYEVEVTVSDDFFSTSQLIEVNLTSLLDEAPVFEDPGTIFVVENTPIGTVVADLNATSRDLDETLVVEFNEFNGFRDFPFAQSIDGELTVARPLDFEGRSAFNIFSIFTGFVQTARQTIDFDTKSVSNEITQFPGVDTLNVQIRLLDDPNDTLVAPTITTTTLRNPENQKVAGFVLAEDPDSDTLTWSITGGADADAFVASGADFTQNGLLRFASAPDFEQAADANGDNVYQVEVTVSDGTLSTSQLVSVEVTNLLEFNASVTPSARSFDIPETAVIGTLIEDFDLIDPDFTPDDAGTFRQLLADRNTFSVSSDGALRLTGPLDFDTQSSYQLFVRPEIETRETLTRNVNFANKTVNDTVQSTNLSGGTVVTINVTDVEADDAVVIDFNADDFSREDGFFVRTSAMSQVGDAFDMAVSNIGSNEKSGEVVVAAQFPDTFDFLSFDVEAIGDGATDIGVTGTTRLGGLQQAFFEDVGPGAIELDDRFDDLASVLLVVSGQATLDNLVFD